MIVCVGPATISLQNLLIAGYQGADDIFTWFRSDQSNDRRLLNEIAINCGLCKEADELEQGLDMVSIDTKNRREIILLSGDTCIF